MSFRKSAEGNMKLKKENDSKESQLLDLQNEIKSSKEFIAQLEVINFISIFFEKIRAFNSCALSIYNKF